MEEEKVLAMAIAAVAEENQVDMRHIRVISFKEVYENDLEKFVKNHHISYHKYQLGDENNE